MRHPLTFLCLVTALLLGAQAADGAQAPPRPLPELYFVDCREDPGSVYVALPGKNVLYTRPSGLVWSLAFAPWDPDLLFLVDRNSREIVQVDLETGAESVVYAHKSTVTGLAFDAAGTLYFSSAYVRDSSGARSSTIWRIDPSAGASVVFTAPRQMLDRSDLDFWGGKFAFAPDGAVLLTTGRTIQGAPQGGFLYATALGSDTLTALYTSPEPLYSGFAQNAAGDLYITKLTSPGTIFALDTTAGTATVHHDFGTGTGICDLAFRPSPPPPGPLAAGTWVMPYGLSAFRVDQIKSSGLVDYSDVVDAPFGGQLGFRLDSANVVPTGAATYYRLSYRGPDSDSWIDFDAPIFVHYVKNRPGKTPIFPLYQLGPEDFGGRNLYRFRPHEEDLPELLDLPPGIPEWPKIGFPGDALRGRLDTVALGLAPGDYDIRYEVYDEQGVLRPPGAGFQMIVPIGVDDEGGLETGPAQITGTGFQLTLHIDNRPTEAAIEPPKIGTRVTDDCGFLRYDSRRPGVVRLAWRAWHPDGHATYSLGITKGAKALGELPLATGSVALPDGDEVTSTAHNGDLGSFWEESPVLDLLDPCTEAAFAARLHVRAKAVDGGGNRLARYDSSVLRAFAIAPLE